MYCEHFGFSEKPFNVTPDPRFLYLTNGHREALASILYGIGERRGFITIIGEVGTGKTTLLNAAIDRLDEKTKWAHIFNTNLPYGHILVMILDELNLLKPTGKLTQFTALRRLNNFAIQQAAKGGNVVIIVDEAQNLSDTAIENLRLLSNLEDRRNKLIQIVLAGQPELEAKLSRHHMRQFVQRISLKRKIATMDKKDTYAYVNHRLDLVNYEGPKLFKRSALRQIWKFSQGTPRKINILCDNALLIAFGMNSRVVKKSVVKEAIKDLNGNGFHRN
ncbi:MAG: DUF2075 domain-containing protein [Desulfobacteraceae bacterium]|nr:MAG: DUF2075 domain-containing protein [Desulfobacteraceae bacterium]